MEKSMIDKMSASSEYSPLVLAYIGDSVHTAYIRCRLIEPGDSKVSDLHRKCSMYVKASAQSYVINVLQDELTEEEIAIYKRGRNAKSATVPKNADVIEYRHATGFEALIGCLYMDKKEERLNYLLSRCFDIINEKNKF